MNRRNLETMYGAALSIPAIWIQAVHVEIRIAVRRNRYVPLFWQRLLLTVKTAYVPFFHP